MIGKTISHYRIIERLGVGGMGVVYKAEDTKLKRTVALKFLPPELTRDPETKKRFIHEAQAASVLEHNNICNIHEIDETEEGSLFIVMACYNGETIRQRIEHSPLKIEATINIAIQIAQGLAKAHEKKIVHRDIKPDNIIITSDGTVKILDFGLAKLTGYTMLTKDGTTLGTVAYMSPEQTHGKEVDHRTDIWSLGVILYEMITGQKPFKGEYDQAVMYSIVNENHEEITGLRTGVPLELERIVDKTLSKNPDERYQHAEDLIVDLMSTQKIIDISKLSSHTTKFQEQVSHTSIPLVLSKQRLAIAAAILVIIFSFIYLRKIFLEPESETQRIVVLPFQNLGQEDDSYFAEGVTEEITSRLSSIHSLSVISRNSALHYSETDKTIKQIGKELNVAYILEGTVRWARSLNGLDRVRITPKLIRVSDDINIWSDEYDRAIADVFEIQSDIAGRIAKQLTGQLLESEQKAIEVRLTNNLDAYQAYLRGNNLARSPHFTIENWIQVEKSYERAIELDSNFSMAYAKLAQTHARFIFFWVDISEERKQKASQAAQKALELASQSGSVHLALSYYYLWAERNTEVAEFELKKAEEKLADRAEIMNARGYIFNLQGRWKEAESAFQYVSKLNPIDADPPMELAFISWVTRHYKKAIEYCDQAIELAPNESWPYLTKTLVIWSWKGATDEAEKTLQKVNPNHEWIPYMWFWQKVFEGKYLEGLDQLKINSNKWIRLKMYAMPKILLAAFSYELMNQPQLAHARYDSARVLLETEVRKFPGDPRYHSSLGIAYAALGNKEKGIEEGKLAVSLLPISKDALYGLPYVQDLAYIYTLSGNYEAAFNQLEYLLSIPHWISTTWLSMDPRWNHLRTYPRFREILEKYRGNN